MGWYTAQCKMLNFELAHQKKKKKEERNILAIWRFSGLVHSQYFFMPLGMLMVMKTLVLVSVIYC